MTNLATKTGLTILSFDWYQGARDFLTKKPIAKPADLAGVRIRTIGQPLWIETIKAMGAVPTPLAWAEVYPSIQTGVIDGAEAQPSAIWGAKLYEVVSDITVTEHIYLMSGLVVSDKWFKSLPEDYQKIVKEEAVRWGKQALKANVEGADKIFADIEKTGVKVDHIDTTPFQEAVKPVYDELGLTDLIAQVQKGSHELIASRDSPRRRRDGGALLRRRIAPARLSSGILPRASLPLRAETGPAPAMSAACLERASLGRARGCHDPACRPGRRRLRRRRRPLQRPSGPLVRRGRPDAVRLGVAAGRRPDPAAQGHFSVDILANLLPPSARLVLDVFVILLAGGAARAAYRMPASASPT